MGFYGEQILPRVTDRALRETVARWQHRLTPFQRRVFGGCHINRPIGRLVTDAGLELTRLDTYYLKGPRAFGYMFDGVAIKPAGPALDPDAMSESEEYR